jgi:small subunit ribosomal protein S8
MYYDLLPRIKNAMAARKEKMTVPFSKMDLAVLKVLVEAGYVKSAEKEAVGKKSIIVVRLPAAKKGDALQFKLISKPSRHIYIDYRSVHRVMQGHGVGVLSTSGGVMSDRAARKNKIGGEYLFEIW